jgi:hypothetical protein
MDSSHSELVSNILARPRMYSSAESIRELLVFISGVCTGIRPPHGSGVLGTFPEFIVSHFGASRESDWCAVLESELANVPYLEACSTIRTLFDKWRAPHA